MEPIIIHLTKTIQEFLPKDFTEDAIQKCHTLMQNYMLLKMHNHDCSIVIMNMYIDIYFDEAFKTAWDMIMVFSRYALPKNLLENFKQINNNKFTQFRFLTKKYSHGKQRSVRSCFKNGDGNYFDWIEPGRDGIYNFTFKIYTKDTSECLFFGVLGYVKYIQSLKQVIDEGDFTFIDLLQTKINWIDSRKDLECFLA